MKPICFFSMLFLFTSSLVAMESKKELLAQAAADSCDEGAIFAILKEKVSALFDEAEKTGDIGFAKGEDPARLNGSMNLICYKSMVKSGLLLRCTTDIYSFTVELATPKGVHSLGGYPSWTDARFKDNAISNLEAKLLQQLELKKIQVPALGGHIDMPIETYYAITTIDNKKIAIPVVEGDRPIKYVPFRQCGTRYKEDSKG